MRADWAALAPTALLCAAALVLERPPAPRAADAPAAEFSAGRAIESVRAIAATPHPSGAAGAERVRAFLVERLRALGLETEVLEARGTSARYDGPLFDVVARRKGTASTGEVLLVAHHDSVPGGPGAADDGAAVAAVLESLRALREGPPPRNDLVVLLTDGEEMGLLGASAYAAQPQRLRDVRVVLNFEARGVSGPTLMFETSRPNDRWIDAYAAVAPSPGANSLMAAVYRRMPNDTDFTVFRRAGVAGLNFAFLEGGWAYHTAADAPENLSLASLEHHGETMLAMLRRLGADDLREPAGEDLVYFDVLGALVVRWPTRLAWIGTAAALLLCAFAWVRGTRAGLVRPGPALAGAGLALGVTGAAALCALGVGRGVLAVFADRIVGPAKGTSFDAALFAAISAATVVLVFLARWGLRRAGSANLAAGALFLWAALLTAAQVWLVEATFLFLVPVAAGAAALLLRASGPASVGRALVVGTLSGLGALVVVPMVPRFFAAMTLERPFVAAALLALFLATLVPGDGARPPTFGFE